MSWEHRIVSEEELKKFVAPPSGGSGLSDKLPPEGGTTNFSLSDKLPPEGGTTNFSLLVRALIRHQLVTWPLLREAVAGFDEVEYESFNVKGSEVLTQFNPKRIVSAGAKVDAAAIGQRPCFLCPDNLPAEEKGIAFGGAFVVLCNPFPVLDDHLVVAARAHTSQAIAGNFGALLDLTRELGVGWFTLYNGPRCGASAPDHLHFQACSSKAAPLFDDVEFFSAQETATGVRLMTAKDYRLNFIAARSAERDLLSAWFERAIKMLAKVTGATEEPMLNLIATHQDEQWTVFVFPRSRHRPNCYFAEGEWQLLVSPGAIDLAGVMVVPHPEHFARITKWDLERIYAEVMLDDERFAKWLALLNEKGRQ